ncbi:MAG: hypothetical protein KAJ22_03615 [Candidatus Izimaplasma sp.]|nr:hypothetical protein [Candidatus Izimaplasma bacterium]
MKGLRIGVTFIIALTIFLLSVFQMQLRGYEKVGRAEEWTVYYHEEDACLEQIEVFYSDDDNNYFFYCLISDRYIIKRGFEEYSLVFGLENDYIEISELSDILVFGTEPITD